MSTVQAEQTSQAERPPDAEDSALDADARVLIGSAAIVAVILTNWLLRWLNW